MTEMLKDLIRKRRENEASLRPDFSRMKTGVNETEQEAKEDKTAKDGGTAVPEVPDDCYRKCNFCRRAILNMDVRKNLYRCPRCGGYFRVHARRRIEMIADAGSFSEICAEMPFVNPLHFPGYENKVKATQSAYGLNEAVVAGSCSLNGRRAVLCVCDGRFIMSSMGHNVGEKITRAFELATKERLPMIIYCCSGGARMQEGIVSLMQMAKTSAAVRRHREAGLLYISVLTNPTTGGVTASFAMLGDVILAEPKALIGFAGPRVIEQTIGQKLPEGFQRSEFLLEHGFVDAIVGREDQKETLVRLIDLHDQEKISTAKQRFAKLPEGDGTDSPDWDAGKGIGTGKDQGSAAGSPEERSSHGAASVPDEASSEKEQKKTEASLKNESSAWERVKRSRDSKRPRAMDYIERLFDGFLELHGDRAFGDDGAIVGGVASFEGLPVTVIAEQKGRSMKENLHCNFGMPSPEGYRKARRLMQEADVFHRPILCFVDTPGAYPGIESEERGQGEAIAQCLYELSGVRVPVLSIVISEGGSGGALALAEGNEVLMLENAVYSILSPEGFASILWKDAKRAEEASELMKITAKDLLSLGIIEGIIPEEEPASLDNIDAVCRSMKEAIRGFFARTAGLSGEELMAQRTEKFRNI